MSVVGEESLEPTRPLDQAAREREVLVGKEGEGGRSGEGEREELDQQRMRSVRKKRMIVNR